MIKFEGVTKKFPNGKIALKDLNFTIEKGEFVFLTGPSGAGKTTILRLLTRELLPTQGKIFFGEEEINKLPKKKIPGIRRRIGAVFQDFKLLSERTIFENVSLALQILGRGEKEINYKVEKALELVGLKGMHKLFPRQLAGGEMQRAALARTLVMEPEVIFADEPTGNLDPATSWQIVDLLKKVNKEGITLVMATHNFDIVDSLGERVVRLEKGMIVSDEKKGKYKK